MTLLGTAGHRPQNGATPSRALRLLAQQVLMEVRPAQLITGMAVGWDMAMARAAVDTGTPFVAAVPFEGQESRWPSPQQAEYRDLLNLAAKVVYVSPPGYEEAKMYRRNAWIIDHMDEAVVLWDGNEGSGTSHFVYHARHRGYAVVNLWDRWQDFRRQL